MRTNQESTRQQELISERGHHRAYESMCQFAGSFAVAASLATGAMAYGEFISHGMQIDPLVIGLTAITALGGFAAYYNALAAMSEGRRADTLDAELYRRESSQPPLPSRNNRGL